ncbi:MAG: glycoside hydrolase family 99-like domain-containing protein [Burkholderiales bacterium]
MRDSSPPATRRPRATRQGAIAGYVRDPATRVWTRAGHASLAYSDGVGVEERLRGFLQGVSDRGVLSDEIHAGVIDWPTEAHLSAIRTNLLRHLQFDAGQRILEVGAGCGAITRFLGESGARVDALEGSLARAACAAERCRDLDSVRVICDEFTQFAAPAKYDVVTMIGVLEYARRFVAGADPVGVCLERARAMLAPGGVLVLAIENQLGLKYFNGCDEDHLGAPFPGITDLYDDRTAVTFGRGELERRLRAAGFRHFGWHYPFPDYKLPSIVVSHQALEASGFSVSDLLFGEFARDYSGNVERCFDESNVWAVLERNALLPELANSLLVVAALKPQASTLEREGNALAYKYSTFRQRPYATCTTFLRNDQGAIEVRKSALDPAAAAQPQAGPARLPLTHRLGTEPYIVGSLFAREFAKTVARGHALPELAARLTPWITLLLRDAVPPEGGTQAGAAWSDMRVSGEHLDFVPFNLIADGQGNLRAIDREFAASGTIPLPWVVLRGLVHTASKCFGHRALRDVTGEQLLRGMLPLLGLADIANWAPYFELEDELVARVLRPWPGRKEKDIFGERVSLPIAAGTSYLETSARNRTRLAAAVNAVRAVVALLGEQTALATQDAAVGAPVDCAAFDAATSDVLAKLEAPAVALFESHELAQLRSTFGAYRDAMIGLRAWRGERAVLKEEFEASRRAHVDALRVAEQSAAAGIADARARIATLEAERTALQERHGEALAKLDADWSLRVDEARAQLAARDEERAAAHLRHAEAIRETEARAAAALGELQAQRASHERELATLRAEHAARLDRSEALLAEAIAEANRQRDERDHRWRELRAESEQRFAQREEALAAALRSVEERLAAREARLAEAHAAHEAAVRERESGWQALLAEQGAAAAARESQLLAQLAAADGAMRAREQQWHEHSAAREAAAALREQELQATVRAVEQRAHERESTLRADLAAVEGSLSQAQVESRELTALLAVANSNIAVETERVHHAERENVLLRQQVREGADELRNLEALLAKQEARSERAEARLAQLNGHWLFRLLKPAWPFAVEGGEHRPVSKRGNAAFQMLRGAYRRLPVSRDAKGRAKDLFYRRFGRLFRNVQNYQLWHSQQATIAMLHDGPAAVGGPGMPSPSTVPDTRPVGPSVAVSVVIPAYGKAAMTRSCVESLLRADPAVPMEIIVVDDGSPEPIAPALEGLPGVTVLRTEGNEGFIGACNRGAALAKEPYLLLLNNDTEVRPGAVSEMLQTFARVPGTGIVGCKLVFPDGRLQEAGAYVRPDGAAEMIGLWDDPNRPCYAYEREVGYTSGACLLIERELYRELGGLDTTFAPAYCEDSDLCFRVRKAGRKIVYQPRAVVVHQLSASMQDSPIDKPAVIATNQRKFLDRWGATLERDDAVRAIAFYLPQYHAIPENDRWWGRGFTDWTNVAKSRPVFPGHRQPNIPADLGFYDLRRPEVRAAQAALARHYGIHGFCYYYYWFGGTRLLHEPLDDILALGEPDFPFCLCWANENWTRRWDGLDSEVLIAQKHSPEDDLAFIASLLPAFRDPRYIRVNGRPLLMVYRPSLLPDAPATVARWRRFCEENGVPAPYLVMTQSFYHLNSTGPQAFGFDAAVEFPPHSLAIEVPTQPRGIGGERFDGRVYDYRATAENFLRREMPPYKLFRSVMPRWDNTPRRGASGNVFLNSTPDAFGHWLGKAADYTRRFSFGEERLLFINAWNEWAEGNYLEPDLQFGHAYLEAVREVLVKTSA